MSQTKLPLDGKAAGVNEAEEKKLLHSRPTPTFARSSHGPCQGAFRQALLSDQEGSGGQGTNEVSLGISEVAGAILVSSYKRRSER